MKAFAAGYACQERYIQERAQYEYPGFTVLPTDYSDKETWYEWGSVDTPTEAALEFAINTGGKVAFAHRTWIDFDQSEVFQNEGEAILIENWIPGYYLFRKVSDFLEEAIGF
ncbi:hypothetical protein D3C72_1872900 [compost metagenome]